VKGVVVVPIILFHGLDGPVRIDLGYPLRLPVLKHTACLSSVGNLKNIPVDHIRLDTNNLEIPILDFKNQARESQSILMSCALAALCFGF
jgi:hypothetical protein